MVGRMSVWLFALFSIAVSKDALSVNEGTLPEIEIGANVLSLNSLNFETGAYSATLFVWIYGQECVQGINGYDAFYRNDQKDQFDSDDGQWLKKTRKPTTNGPFDFLQHSEGELFVGNVLCDEVDLEENGDKVGYWYATIEVSGLHKWGMEKFPYDTHTIKIPFEFPFTSDTAIIRSSSDSAIISNTNRDFVENKFRIKDAFFEIGTHDYDGLEGLPNETGEAKYSRATLNIAIKRIETYHYYFFAPIISIIFVFFAIKTKGDEIDRIALIAASAGTLLVWHDILHSTVGPIEYRSILFAIIAISWASVVFGLVYITMRRNFSGKERTA